MDVGRLAKKRARASDDGEPVTRTESRREFRCASDSLMTAINPTAQQIQAFCAATAQMLADLMGDEVALELPMPYRLRVARRPGQGRKYGT